MRLVIESPIIMPYVSEILSILIDGAQIHLDNIQYNESQRKTEILLRRKELVGFKRPFFGRRQPIYGQGFKKTLLTIKDTVEVKIKTDDRLLSDLNSTFTVLFGVRLDNEELYLGSVEESQGKIFCQVFVKIERLNIECVDLE